MAIELQTFASGDTDYIAKLNANVATLMEAIGHLQTQMEVVGGTSTVSVGQFLNALFNNADALIGPSSYTPTTSGTTLTVAPGGMYLVEDHTTVLSLNNVPLNFIAKGSGTYYVRVDVSGIPSIDTLLTPGAIYSVVWTGSAFGQITRIASVFYDTKESEASRRSLALESPVGSPPERLFSTLDERLEVGEVATAEAREKADAALTLAYELGMEVGPHAGSHSSVGDDPVTVTTLAGFPGGTTSFLRADGTFAAPPAPPVIRRQVTFIIDGGGSVITVGQKGYLSLPVAGAWKKWRVLSVDAGATAGSIVIDVWKDTYVNYPPTVTDTITASAKPTLSGVRSNESATLTGWTTAFSAGDVIGFYVDSVTTVTKVMLVLEFE